jgi:hypothetical protein
VLEIAADDFFVGVNLKDEFRLQTLVRRVLLNPVNEQVGELVDDAQNNLLWKDRAFAIRAIVQWLG